MVDEQHSNEDSVARIRARIATLVEEHFANGMKHVFLARLGSQLGEDRVQLERLTGRKLAQFIRENFDYEIQSMGVHNNVLVLLAPGAVGEAIPTAVPRYQTRFWAAFAKPLRPGEERIIDLSTLQFGPRGEMNTPGRDLRPISAEFVAPEDTPVSAADTVARISRWLEEQHLGSERFLQHARRSGIDDTSLLERVLNALDGDQLRRVALPLDVIKSLADARA